jgi:hypothetical protein
MTDVQSAELYQTKHKVIYSVDWNSCSLHMAGWWFRLVSEELFSFANANADGQQYAERTIVGPSEDEMQVRDYVPPFPNRLFKLVVTHYQ